VALTPKGAARREALLDAVLRILEADGPSGVTHRAVAAEAGVPLAAATYYFASIDDLLVSAMKRAVEEQVDMFAGLAQGDVASAAQAIWSWVYETRAFAISQYELMLLAMRRESLREDADAWYSALENALAPLGLSPERARVAAFGIDGLVLRMLWRGEPSTPETTEIALRELLELND
jgi:DNA-binding transcriptional regulator YbjK